MTQISKIASSILAIFSSAHCYANVFFFFRDLNSILSAGFEHPEQVSDFGTSAGQSHSFPLASTDERHVLQLAVVARQRCQDIPFLTPELVSLVAARRQQLLASSCERKETKTGEGRKLKRRRQSKSSASVSSSDKVVEVHSNGCRSRPVDIGSESDGPDDSAPFGKRVSSPAISVPRQASNDSLPTGRSVCWVLIADASGVFQL